MQNRTREYPSIAHSQLPEKPVGWLTLAELAHALHVNTPSLQDIWTDLTGQARDKMNGHPQVVTVAYEGKPLQIIYARNASQETWYAEPAAVELFAHLTPPKIGEGWYMVQDLIFKYDSAVGGPWKRWCAMAEAATPDADGTVTLHEFGHAFRMKKGHRCHSSPETWYAEGASIQPVLAHFPAHSTHFVMQTGPGLMGKTLDKTQLPAGTAAAEKREMKMNPRRYLTKAALVAELHPEELEAHYGLWPRVCAEAEAPRGLVHLDGGKDITVDGVSLRTRPEKTGDDHWETALDAASLNAYRVALNAARPVVSSCVAARRAEPVITR